MRKLFGVVAMLMYCSGVSLGQVSSQTIQVGYAVLTPSAPGITGLSAYETIVQARTSDTLQVGVFPENLVTNGLLPVQISANLARTVGIAVANPNNVTVNLNLTLRRSDGTLFRTETVPVLARQQIAKLLTEIFLPPPAGGFTTQLPIPPEFTGSLGITSSLPVSILGLNFRGQNYSTVPLTDLAPANNPVPVIQPNVGGAGAFVFPQFVAGGGWSSEITITNTTASPLTVRLDLFTQAGAPFTVTLNGQTSTSFTNLVIPANGILVVAP